MIILDFHTFRLFFNFLWVKFWKLSNIKNSEIFGTNLKYENINFVWINLKISNILKQNLKFWKSEKSRNLLSNLKTLGFFEKQNVKIENRFFSKSKFQLLFVSSIFFLSWFRWHFILIIFSCLKVILWFFREIDENCPQTHNNDNNNNNDVHVSVYFLVHKNLK